MTKKKAKTFYFPEVLDNWVKKISKEHGISESELVRRILDEERKRMQDLTRWIINTTPKSNNGPYKGALPLLFSSED